MKRILCILSLVAVTLIGFSYAGQQASNTVASTIIDRAQIILSDADGNFYTDAKLLYFVNMGVQDIASKTKCMDVTYPVLLQTGVTEYSIGSGTSYFTINTAVYVESGTSNYKGLKKSNPQSIGHVQNAGEPVWWYQSEDNIGVYPPPSSGVSGDQVTAYLTKRPLDVTATEVVPTPAVYDNALVYYVVAQSSYMDLQKGRGDMYLALYVECLKQYRADIEDRPIEAVKEIIK